jgi:hypothetical protein
MTVQCRRSTLLSVKLARVGLKTNTLVVSWTSDASGLEAQLQLLEVMGLPNAIATASQVLILLVRITLLTAGHS